MISSLLFISVLNAAYMTANTGTPMNIPTAPNNPENTVIEIRGLKIDKTARRVWIDGEEKSFTTKEFDLLTFLAENPKSNLTFKDFFKTKADIEGNVNYLYRVGAPTQFASTGAYDCSLIAYTSLLTGYFVNVYEGQELQCNYSRLLTRQDNTQSISEDMDGLWDGCYRVINNANGIIKAIPDVVQSGSMSSADGARLDGEARFFRAFNYLMLVKFFGDVPKSEEFLYDLSFDTELPRTPKAEVLALVESDLKTASANLPDAKFAANGHRITKWVAEMALTDMYFWQAKYAEAAAEAKKIIASGKISLAQNKDTGLNSAYNQLRALDDLDEVIDAYEFEASLGKSA